MYILDGDLAFHKAILLYYSWYIWLGDGAP